LLLSSRLEGACDRNGEISLRQPPPHQPQAPRFLHCALRASAGMTRLLRARRYRSLMQRCHKVLVAPCLATKWPLLCGSGNAEKALEARTSDEPYKWPRNCWQMQQTWIMGANSQRKARVNMRFGARR